MRHLRLILGLAALMLVTITAQAAKGDIFTIDNLTYTVLTENASTKKGTVSVKAASTTIEGHVDIPATVINNGITYTVNSLASASFYNCSKMTSVSIPKTITKWNYNKHFEGTNVSKVYVDNLNQYLGWQIEDDALCPIDWELYINNVLLDTLVLNNNTPIIYPKAFSKCKLKKIDASGLTNISSKFWKESIFKNCKQLEEVVFSDTLTQEITGNTWGKGWFEGCTSLKKIKLPYGIKQISRYFLKGCTSLEEITIPNSVTILNLYCFSECTGLKNVQLSEALTQLNGYTFEGCTSLESITLPLSLQSIMGGDFRNCSNLKEVKNLDTAPITFIGSMTFTDCKIGPVVVLPKTLTVLGPAFSKCKNIKEVVFPESLTEIRDGSTSMLSTDGGCFHECISLEKLTNFENTQIEIIPQYCFSNCVNLSNIDYPRSVTEIKNGAFFYCRKLTSFYIHDNVTKIYPEAFLQCDGLHIIKIPNSVISIDKYAFRGAANISHITLPSWLKKLSRYIQADVQKAKEITIPAYVETNDDVDYMMPLRYSTDAADYSRSIYVMGDSINPLLGDEYESNNHQNTTIYVKKSVYENKYPNGNYTHIRKNTSINYNVSYNVPVSMTNASGNPIEYKTLCRDFDVDLTHTNDNLPEGVEPLRAYLVEDVEGDLRMVFMNEIKYIPSRLKANVTDENGNLYQGVDEYVGVVLRGTPGYTYYYRIGEHDYTQGAEGQWLMEDAMAYSNSSDTNNMLAGDANDEFYVYKTVEDEDNNEIVNYGLNSNKFKIYNKDGWLNYNKAYLQLPKYVSDAIEGDTDAEGNANLTFVFSNADGSTDKVSSIEFNQNCESDIFYNPYGQQVAPNTKGVVINNGKKFVNK